MRYEGIELDDAKLVVTAYGSTARIAKTAIRLARKEGMKVGLLRPITLFPFPKAAFKQCKRDGQRILCFELNNGQMVEDVRLAVRDVEVDFYGRAPGAGSLPTPEEFLAKIRSRYEA